MEGDLDHARPAVNHTRPPQDYRNRYEPILYGWKMGADRREIEDCPPVAVAAAYSSALGRLPHLGHGDLLDLLSLSDPNPPFVRPMARKGALSAGFCPRRR